MLVQRVPAGFLDALGIKSTGRNPSESAEYVQPMVDLSEMYLARSAVGLLNFTNTAQAMNSVVSLVVPDGFVWFVKVVSGFVTVAAGESASIQLNVAPPGINGAGIAHSGLVTAIAANASICADRTFDSPLILTAGSVVQTVLRDTNLAAGRTMTIHVLAYQLSA